MLKKLLSLFFSPNQKTYQITWIRPTGFKAGVDMIVERLR
jgi:hypothetical protein